MAAMNVIDWSGLDESARERLLRRPAVGISREQATQVAAIIAEVRRDGDRALYRLTERFDGVAL
jgi:histidinol dehydrogenase